MHAQLQGTIAQSGDGRHSTVTIAARLVDATSGAALGQVQIVLRGAALDDGGLALREGTMTLGPTGQPQAYQGAVTSPGRGRRPGPGPAARRTLYTAQARLAIDAASQQVTGTIDVHS